MSAAVVPLPTVHTTEDLHRLNPARAPDWRYRRALKLIGPGPRERRCTEFDDDFIREMQAFMLGHRADDENERRRLASQFPGLALALEIHERADPELRLELECCILAGMSDAQIATRLGISSDAVAAYEQAFFSIRDRLGCRNWIHITVLDSGRRRRLPGTERWLKTLAFVDGPAAVDLLFGADRTVSDRHRRSFELVDQFMTAFENDYSALQQIELSLFINVEKHANRSAAATRDAFTAAARQTLETVENPACDQQDQEPRHGVDPVDVYLVA